MNKQNHPSRLRRWLNDISIEDPVNRQMASQLQVMLLGLITTIVIATIVNMSLLNWEATNLHSLIEVPLIVGDACLGTLSVARLDPDSRFTERELALVESVGRQTATAIQNARLFESQA